MLHIMFIAVKVDSLLCDPEQLSEETNSPSYGYGNLIAQVCSYY